MKNIIHSKITWAILIVGIACAIVLQYHQLPLGILVLAEFIEVVASMCFAFIMVVFIVGCITEKRSNDD